MCWDQLGTFHWREHCCSRRDHGVVTHRNSWLLQKLQAGTFLPGWYNPAENCSRQNPPFLGSWTTPRAPEVKADFHLSPEQHQDDKNMMKKKSKNRLGSVSETLSQHIEFCLIFRSPQKRCHLQGTKGEMWRSGLSSLKQRCQNYYFLFFLGVIETLVTCASGSLLTVLCFLPCY